MNNDAATTARTATQQAVAKATPAHATTFAGLKSDAITTALTKYEAQISQALPHTAKDLNAQRIIQITATLISRDDKLKKCDAGSIVASVMQAAILGLNPLPQLAECYFVPYWNGSRSQMECQFQIGYRGYVNLYHRCHIIESVFAAVVCDGDEFSYEYGLAPVLKHRPIVEPAINGSNITHAYAVARYLNGGSVFIVLPKARIEALRLKAPKAKLDEPAPAWRTDYEAMACAKALKQLKRFIPSDGAIDTALAIDERTMTLHDFQPDGSGLDVARLATSDDGRVSEDTSNGTSSRSEATTRTTSKRSKTPATIENSGIISDHTAAETLSGIDQPEQQSPKQGLEGRTP